MRPQYVVIFMLSFVVLSYNACGREFGIAQDDVSSPLAVDQLPGVDDLLDGGAELPAQPAPEPNLGERPPEMVGDMPSAPAPQEPPQVNPPVPMPLPSPMPRPGDDIAQRPPTPPMPPEYDWDDDRDDDKDDDRDDDVDEDVRDICESVKRQNKVCVCHYPAGDPKKAKTLVVSKNALKGLLKLPPQGSSQFSTQCHNQDPKPRDKNTEGPCPKPKA